jgi:hypothetical protein
MGFSFKTENDFFGTFILYLPKYRYERTICIKISELGPVKVSKKANQNKTTTTTTNVYISLDNCWDVSRKTLFSTVLDQFDYNILYKVEFSCPNAPLRCTAHF